MAYFYDNNLNDFYWIRISETRYNYRLFVGNFLMLALQRRDSKVHSVNLCGKIEMGKETGIGEMVKICEFRDCGLRRKSIHGFGVDSILR
jgi:hypothetical protein